MNSIGTLEGALQLGAGLGYLLASLGYSAFLQLRNRNLIGFGRVAAACAVLLHTGAIGVHCAAAHTTPFTSPADALSASAWAIAVVTLLLEAVFKLAPSALAAIAMPAAFFCLFTGSVMHDPTRVHDPLSQSILASNMISLHVLAILFAYGLSVLAFACALLYVLHHRLLKHKRVGGGLFGKLPPLAKLDQLAFTLVVFSFTLLTIGLLSGAIRVGAAGWPDGWASDQKIVASLLTWFVYGIYLVLHHASRWRGVRANYLLLVGPVLTLITFFVPTSVHRY